jgi:hypothetical protein
MARNRMIKPEFWEDSKMAELCYPARLFFIAMWNFADDEGYLEHDIRWLKAKCMPYDKVDISELLNELLKAGRIEINNDIIHIKNFLKHQRIDKPKPSPLSELFQEQSRNIPRTIQDDSTTKEKLSKEKLSKEKLSKEKLRQDKLSYMSFENDIIQSWNSFCLKYPVISKIKEITETRRTHLKARYEKESFRDCAKIFEAIEKQPFLIHGNPNAKEHKDWKISFDWLISNDTNYVKVLEMKYLNVDLRKEEYLRKREALNAITKPA